MAEVMRPTPPPVEAIKHGEPIGPQTIKASADVAADMAGGGTPKTAHVEKLTDALEAELARDGIKLTDEERKAWREGAKAMAEPPKDAEQAIEFPPKEPLDFDEYFRTVREISTVYGLDRYQGDLRAVQASLVAARIIHEVARSGYIAAPGRTSQGTIAGLRKVAQGLIRWRTQNPDQRRKLIHDGARYARPILTPLVLNLLSIRLELGARRRLGKLLLAMGRTVNSRISESLFMHNFEFIHDKTPAEILNIVERGKSATLDLLGTTYGQVLPALTTIGARLLPEWRISPIAAAFSILRLPFMYRSSKRGLEELMWNRKIDALQKEFVDSRLASLLGNIEAAKTSGNIEGSIHALRQAMEAREGLQRKRYILTVGREKRELLTNLVFDQLAPLLIAGYEFVKQRKYYMARSGAMGGQGDILSSLFPPAQAAAFHAFSKYQISRYMQESTKAHALGLVALYANNIQPDIQDIKRMEELLGPWSAVDRPEGPKEKARMPVGQVPRFDIQVDGVRFKKILHSVSLEIPQGSYTTVKGPSGIGKTTLLRTMLGLYQPETGEVRYGGIPLDKVKKFGDESIYTQIGYANQNPQYLETLTLRENLLLWTRHPVPDEKLESLMHELKLDHLVTRLGSRAKHYSGGELRRIGIARALLKDPKVLFLDEPTANLDEESAAQVTEVLKNLRAKRPEMTIVAITHDPAFEKIADRVVDFRSLNKAPENASGLPKDAVFFAQAEPAPTQAP